MDQPGRPDETLFTPRPERPPTTPTHAPRLPSEVHGRIPERHAGRTMIVWTAVIALVGFLVALQAITRYAGDSVEAAPKHPSEVGSMQIRISARHGVGIKPLDRIVASPGGQSTSDQIIKQLNEAAKDQPVQLIRVSGYLHFFRPDDPSAALASLNKAQEFIDQLEEELREQWEERGYHEDIAAFRAIINDGPESLTPDQRDRLLERYDEFAVAALIARLDDSDPERRAFLSKGLRTSITLITAILVVIVAAITGLVLFIVGMVMLSSGRIQPQYKRSLLPGPDEPAEGAPPPFTLETFAWFLIAFLVVQIVVGSAIAHLSTALGIAENLRMLLLLPFLWALLIFALWPVWQGASGAWNRRALGLHRGKGVLREIGAGFVGYLAGLPIVALGFAGTFVMILISGLLGLDTDGSHPAPDAIAGGGAIAIIALICLAVMWAPVVEEIFFRGALQHHLRRSHGFIVSALITGFIFAAIHPQGLVGIPVLTAIGFVFSMLREWRGSIIAPIVAHAINNGFVFTMLIVALA